MTFEISCSSPLMVPASEPIAFGDPAFSASRPSDCWILASISRTELRISRTLPATTTGSGCRSACDACNEAPAADIAHMLRITKRVVLDRSHENLIISSSVCRIHSIQVRKRKTWLFDDIEQAFIATRHQWAKCYREGSAGVLGTGSELILKSESVPGSLLLSCLCRF